MNNCASAFLSKTADPSWVVSGMDLQRDSVWEVDGPEGPREGETGTRCDALFQRAPVSSCFEKKGWLAERLFAPVYVFSSSPMSFKNFLTSAAPLSSPGTGVCSDILPLQMFCLDVQKTACICAIVSV